MTLNLTSRKLALGLTGLAVIMGTAILDALCGLGHGELLIKATVTLGLGGVGVQGWIDLFGTADYARGRADAAKEIAHELGEGLAQK